MSVVLIARESSVSVELLIGILVFFFSLLGLSVFSLLGFCSCDPFFIKPFDEGTPLLLSVFAAFGLSGKLECDPDMAKSTGPSPSDFFCVTVCSPLDDLK